MKKENTLWFISCFISFTVVFLLHVYGNKAHLAAMEKETYLVTHITNAVSYEGEMYWYDVITRENTASRFLSSSKVKKGEYVKISYKTPTYIPGERILTKTAQNF